MVKLPFVIGNPAAPLVRVSLANCRHLTPIGLVRIGVKTEGDCLDDSRELSPLVTWNRSRPDAIAMVSIPDRELVASTFPSPMTVT